MSGVTVYETFNCGVDCDGWGGSCPGHQACLIFQGSSESYKLEIDAESSAGFTKATMSVLLTLARRISDHHACAARYVPEGYVLVPVTPTQEMLDAGWDADEACADVPTTWQAMLAARPEVP